MNLIVDIDQLDRLCRAQINAWFQQVNRRMVDLAYDVECATPTKKLALAIRDGTCRWRHCNTTICATANTADRRIWQTTKPDCTSRLVDGLPSRSVRTVAERFLW